MQRFPSKVDWWLAVLLAAVPIIAAGTAIALSITGSLADALVGWGVFLALWVLYTAVVWPVAYEVGEGQLVVRFGVVRSRIPLAEVESIKPSRSLLASPALSLDRLRIDRRDGGYVLISPADRDGFVRAILESRRGVRIDPNLGGWSPIAPGAAQPAPSNRPPVRELEKDGRLWRIGGPEEVAWIAEGVTSDPPGYAMSVAVPPIFEAYATFYPAGDPPGYPPGTTLLHERAVVRNLAARTPEQPWWLGYLETGAHDVVFDDAPRVSLYFGWDYVLVEAGPEEALTWREGGHTRAGDGVLPDLFFPADRSWLVSGLWDDGWTCIGGPADLIEALRRDPDVAARPIGPDDDRKPPGLSRY